MQSSEEFIQNYLLPTWIGAENKKINTVIYDIEGKIIFITNNFANLFNCHNWRLVVGKKLQETMREPDPDMEAFFKDIDSIRMKVVNTQNLEKYITIKNYAYGLDAFVVFHYPIFMEDGTLVATQAISKRMTNYHPLINFNKIFQTSIESNTQTNAWAHFSLTEEEYEILFLLNLGLTQDEAADLHGISRSKLAKIINYKIAPKLGITDNSLQDLIKKANKFKIFNSIPSKFLRPQVIKIKHIEYDLDIFR
jgi:predicted DNA-binding protein (UPF0251 family)